MIKSDVMVKVYELLDDSKDILLDVIKEDVSPNDMEFVSSILRLYNDIVNDVKLIRDVV